MLRDALRVAAAAALVFAARAAAGPAQPPSSGLWSASLAAYNRNDQDAALRDARALLAREPDNPLYRRHEAAVLYARRDFAGAAAALERFMASAPEPTQACPLIANAYRRLNDAPRFLDALKRCLAFDPHNAEWAFNYAQGLEETGDLRGAAALFSRLAGDGFLGGAIALGRVRLKQGAPDRALAVARAALEREPGNTAAHLVAAQAAFMLGDRPEARRHWSQARKSAPSHPEVLRLGRLLGAP